VEGLKELPAVVARMWGRDAGSRKGPRPSLDFDRIVTAAIEIADTDGLAGVRMSSVASHLGVATMTLYRYVGSKEELVTAMVDAAAPPPPALAPGRAWRDYLSEWTRANRDFYLVRPWLLQVPQIAPPIGPRGLLWLDRVIAALDGTGLSSGERINIAATLSGYAMSQAALASQMNSEVEGPGEYAAILAGVLDPRTHPALAAAVGEGAFGDASEWIDDADFTFGLRLLLDGVEALIAERAARRARPSAP
jgi:AcrR family transcriptional regulator